MRSVALFRLLIFFSLFAAVCSTSPVGEATDLEDQIASETTTVITGSGTTATKTLDVGYTSSDSLDVWQPGETSGAPIAVVLHGSGGVRGIHDPIAEALVDHGFVVINPSWNVMTPFPDNVAGAACAVRFARAQAVQLGGDPQRVLLVGHSAGGAAAALIALGGDDFDRDACVFPDTSALPNGYTGLAGGYDPASDPNDPRRELQTSDPDTYELVNPTTHLGNNPNLRVQLVHGDEDEVVPLQSAITFHQRLVDAGYDATLTVLEGSGHTEMVTDVFPEFEAAIEATLEAAGIEQ